VISFAVPFVSALSTALAGEVVADREAVRLIELIAWWPRR
jgi:hypothetical protein